MPDDRSGPAPLDAGVPAPERHDGRIPWKRIAKGLMPFVYLLIGAVFGYAVCYLTTPRVYEMVVDVPTSGPASPR